jgi:acyl-coenzyme A synthetase/AMP-(fatty) acid ligase
VSGYWLHRNRLQTNSTDRPRAGSDAPSLVLDHKNDNMRPSRTICHWPNSIEMAKLLFACFKAGLIAVPINLFLKAPEIGHILANSGP